ncbi:VOC family protein [Paraburkholderia sp. EG287B]|uniref:VOC family protein n=1 Tax=Paraburkholderia sp. EG287B TaxID=3237010 RepID=UPI0034D1D852
MMAAMATQQIGSSDTDDLPRHRRILQESGPAAGRISGINHLVMFARDMNEAVRFYRDVLGMRVVRTQRFETTAKGLRSAAHHSSGAAAHEAPDSSPIAVDITVRQVFFEMGNGELFSLYEAPTVTERPPAPVSSVLWPAASKSQWSRPVEPQKLDHLAFDVRSHADVVWFREHLLSQGVAVSEVSERKGANNTHRFISSIYFSDPSGNPLEISSFNAEDVAWQSYDFSDWFVDEDPVPALLDDGTGDVQRLVPHWVRTASE